MRHWLDDLPRPWAVDLYSGAGGLSLGLQDAGFSIVAAADFDSVAMETHKANIPSLAWVG
ncbi:MAG: DNA cytosine methyltransferase, partial [Chloroflexi bacterium]|nr:DNA cytosine methyltransferase [Chloroflexota bacterium]